MSDKETKTVEQPPVRPVVVLRALKQKVQQLLAIEFKMTQAERQCQQWQLLFQIKGMGQVVVGKGGINTMFYQVGNGERELCLPQKLGEVIDTWIALANTTTYCIVNAEGKVVKRNLSKAEALNYPKAKTGYLLCEVADGKRKKLMKMSKGLMGKSAWKAIERKDK